MTPEREVLFARAGKLVPQWREEDRANGIIWADERERVPGTTVRCKHGAAIEFDGCVDCSFPLPEVDEQAPHKRSAWDLLTKPDRYAASATQPVTEREQTLDKMWRCTPPGLTVREMHDGDGIVPVLVPREGNR